ncbi:hypothetical protein [Nostoc sp.]|uniref:hypothetical protein n=1 Tax=Nostoc sp. TaxID=1180 RepID=UPI002FF9AB76
MVSRFGMGIWGSGRFGLSLQTSVGLWCAIGWLRLTEITLSTKLILSLNRMARLIT